MLRMRCHRWTTCNSGRGPIRALKRHRYRAIRLAITALFVAFNVGEPGQPSDGRGTKREPGHIRVLFLCRRCRVKLAGNLRVSLAIATHTGAWSPANFQRLATAATPEPESDLLQVRRRPQCHLVWVAPVLRQSRIAPAKPKSPSSEHPRAKTLGRDYWLAIAPSMAMVSLKS